jgi:hypothetical protein
MAETVGETVADTLARRRAFEDETSALRIARARERIRKNFPNERAPLQWRRDSPTRMVSTCGRFAIEKSGEGEAVRYTAKLQPHSIIGCRRFTVEQAKEDCDRHASPLPLESPGTPELPLVEREPGSDDE